MSDSARAHAVDRAQVSRAGEAPSGPGTVLLHDGKAALEPSQSAARPEPRPPAHRSFASHRVLDAWRASWGSTQTHWTEVAITAGSSSTIAPPPPPSKDQGRASHRHIAWSS